MGALGFFVVSNATFMDTSIDALPRPCSACIPWAALAFRVATLGVRHEWRASVVLILSRLGTPCC